MLTRENLRWVYGGFSLYSKLCIIPAEFSPVHLGGLMVSGSVSIWREIGFKCYQFMVTAQTSFMLARTLEYMTGANEELNWDFVPVMLTLSTYFPSINLIARNLFGLYQTLNTKVYNQIRTLRGKYQKPKTNRNLPLS